MFGGRRVGDHNRRMFFVHIAYILLVSSGMNPGLKGGLWCWRLQMVCGYATQEVEGGVPLLVSSTEALRNHR